MRIRSFRQPPPDPRRGGHNQRLPNQRGCGDRRERNEQGQGRRRPLGKRGVHARHHGQVHQVSRKRKLSALTQRPRGPRLARLSSQATCKDEPEQQCDEGETQARKATNHQTCEEGGDARPIDRLSEAQGWPEPAGCGRLHSQRRDAHADEQGVGSRGPKIGSHRALQARAARKNSQTDRQGQAAGQGDERRRERVKLSFER